jgi:Bacterial TSP3 repeat
MEMLPSKKILVMLALLIVGIGALVIYAYERGSNTDYINTSNQNALVVASSSVSAATSQIDSDHDGLPDWEETLYGTDPHNPDTDGDGTPDGQEVALGRNPLVKGPNDFLASKNNPNATSTEKENLTLTDTFARNFFTEYMNMQQSGVQITSTNADQIASDYLKKTPLPSITAKQYTQADLSLTDSDQAHLSSYQNAITAIFAKYWPTGKTNELSIMQQAFVNNDTKALDNMTVIISAYQNTLSNSLTLSVPKLAVSLHLNMINSLSVYIQTLKMIQLAYTDPLSGLVGLNAYQTNQANVLVSMANLRMYFINNLK